MALVSQFILHHQPRCLGPGLAAVDRRLGAPLLRQPPHAPVHLLVEPQQVADYAAVQQGTVGVGVGQVGGQQVQLAELVEDAIGGGKLLIPEGAEVEDGEGFGGAYGNYPSAVLAGRRPSRFGPGIPCSPCRWP